MDRHSPGVGLAADAHDEVNTNLVIVGCFAAALAKFIAAMIIGGMTWFGSGPKVISDAM